MGPTEAGEPSHARRGWFDALIDALAIVAGVGMCLLTLLVCCDVAARYFRLFAMPWSLDVAEYALFVITFLGAPWVLVRRGHISIDIAIERLSEDTRRKVAALANALGALTCGALLFFSVWTWWRSFSQGTTVHETFVFPEWWLFALPPPMFLIMMGIFLRWLRRAPDAPLTAPSQGL